MHKTIRTLVSLFSLIMIVSGTGCDAQPPAFNIDTYTGKYRSLAKAIDEEDTAEIIKQVKEHELDVNHKDEAHGISLLRWSLYNDKYNSCKTLLELGANPNQIDSSKERVPPITMAARKAQTSEYLKLMLKHGGNPNIVSKGELGYTEATPLCAAAASRLESVRLLIANGADVNFSPSPEILPLTTSLITDQIEITKYMVMQMNAKVKKAFMVRVDNDTARIEDLLRLNIFPLESPEHKIKMEVVSYLKSVGINYRAARIPKFLFNNYTQDFLNKY